MKVKVAVIDDGINIQHISSPCLCYCVLNNRMVRFNNANSSITHGTIIGSIIDNRCSQVNFYSIKIMNSYKENADIKDLETALVWCIENRIQVINLSLGSVNYFDRSRIVRLMYLLKRNNIIVIAAYSNKDRITYPASLDFVIGVKRDVTNILKSGEYIYVDKPLDGIDIICGCRQSCLGVDFEKCNSFATPEITAKVCTYLIEGPILSVHQIKSMLKRDSFYSIGHDKLKDTTNNMDKPVIIINNQSTHFLVDILKTIIEEFSNDRYNCVGLLKNYQSLEHNIFSINEIGMKVLINYIDRCTNFDLAIIGFDNQELEISIDFFDIVINICENSIDFEYDKKSKKHLGSENICNIASYIKSFIVEIMTN